MTDPSADLGLFAPPSLDATATRDLLEDIDAIVWTVEPHEPDVRRVSASAERLLGHPLADWRAPGFWSGIVHPDDRPTVMRRLRQLAAHGGAVMLEYRVRRPDGAERWWRDRVRAVRDAAGRPRLQGVVFDITPEKRAERAVREQRDLADAILETSPMLIALLDADGVVRRTNPACGRMLGAAEGELTGQRFDDCFVAPSDQALARILMQRVREGREIPPTEIRTRRRDGSASPVCWTLSAAPQEPDRPLRLVASGFDVSERVASEQRLLERAAGLRHAQKMEAIGRLASGVSHEFNNLFTALLGFTQALESEVGDDPRLSPLTEGLRETLSHATALTSQLRSMGRRDTGERRPMDLAAEVAARVPLLRRLLGEEMTIELDLPGAGSRVSGDPGQLQQVLLNLVLNARDAMRGAGAIRIRVTRESGAGAGPAVVELAVCDHGSGMDEETRARIFEPFFSTKGDAGSGLGLSAVYAIVGQWGGDVVAESEPGRGTCMRLRLPEWSASVVEPPRPADAGPPRRPSRILLAEDEPRVRRLLIEALRRDGHDLIAAADGREALELAAAQAEPLDLLVTDVVMPRMGGRELAERLRAIQPGLRVLFVSGYSDDAMIQRGVPPTGVEFLHKPFPPALLIRRVRELLAAEPASA